MDILLATNNKHKLEEFRRIFLGTDINILSLSDVNLTIDVVEDQDSFLGNSKKKAMEVYKAAGISTIADDSGLCVDFLGGDPGVYSARYGGEHLTDKARCELVMDKLFGVEKSKRGARFVCAITLVSGGTTDNDIKVEQLVGECSGYIGEGFDGDNGFGYDPIFMVGDKSFAAMSGEEKDRISHRGIALRKLKELLTGAHR